MIIDLNKNTFSKLSSYEDHERLISFSDDKVGLRGYIGIHNTNLGQATGGTRLKEYSNDELAMSDALNLSRAMTYKCALAGVSYGGGKSVIIYNGRKDREFLEVYASIINELNGDFTTGKDAGIGDEEISHMAKISPYINSRTGRQDPSIYAGIGVYIAMKATAEKIYGTDSLKGRRVAIKGLGQVGYELARLISEDGGRLVVADINSSRLDSAINEFNNVEVVSHQDINKVACDIYSPCALGGEFTHDNIEDLNCDIICGAANNQLASPEVGHKIKDLGVVYVPDYVANAGGLIAVVDGHSHKDFDHERVKGNLGIIAENVRKIIDMSFIQKRATHELADELAESIFKRRANV
jgi:leucine dehydrogenase